MHGLPRMVNAKLKRVKALWMLLTLGGTLILLYHTSELVSQFLSKPTTVAIKPRGAPFVAPDIHFCNEYYAFSNAYMIWEEGFRQTEAGKRIEKIKDKLTDVLSDNRTETYYDSIWDTIPSHLLYSAYGHKYQQSQASAFGSNAKVLPYNSYDIMPHWKHFNCFRFRPRQTDFNVVDKKLTFFLFIESSYRNATNLKFGNIPLTDVDFVGQPDADKSSGIQVYFTPQGFYPHIDSTRVIATPGFKTTISLSMKRYEMISKKENPCTRNPRNVSYLNMLVDPPEMVEYSGYGYLDCLNEKFHQMTLEKCGCVTHYYPLTAAMLDKKPNFCFNLTLLSEPYNYTFTSQLENTLKNRLKCIETTRNSVSERSHDCGPARHCRRDHYSATWSLSRWCLTTSYISMYAKMLRLVYMINTRTRNLTLPGFEEYVPNVAQASFVRSRENFAKVIIHTEEVNSTLYHEEYTYLVRNIASDMGGIVGFYLGISVLTICEIFEMMVIIIKPRELAQEESRERIAVTLSREKRQDLEIANATSELDILDEDDETIFQQELEYMFSHPL